jgi:PAS domain-containing protein
MGPSNVDHLESEQNNFAEDHTALDSNELTHAKGPSEESERWLWTAVHHSSDFVVILETDATVRYVSPAVERVLSYRPEDIVGTIGFDYVHSEDLEYVSNTFTRRRFGLFVQILQLSATARTMVALTLKL